MSAPTAAPSTTESHAGKGWWESDSDSSWSYSSGSTSAVYSGDGGEDGTTSSFTTASRTTNGGQSNVGTTSATTTTTLDTLLSSSSTLQTSPTVSNPPLSSPPLATQTSAFPATSPLPSSTSALSSNDTVIFFTAQSGWDASTSGVVSTGVFGALIGLLLLVRPFASSLERTPIS